MMKRWKIRLSKSMYYFKKLLQSYNKNNGYDKHQDKKMEILQVLYPHIFDEFEWG